MAMRSFRLQMEAQYAVIKALDRVARRLGREPKLAAHVFLHSEMILSSFRDFCLSIKGTEQPLNTLLRYVFLSWEAAL
jgi:hypothetical protein